MPLSKSVSLVEMLKTGYEPDAWNFFTTVNVAMLQISLFLQQFKYKAGFCHAL